MQWYTIRHTFAELVIFLALDLTVLSAYVLFLQTVNPKTDEQRAKLNEAVKNILIFKALDSVSWKGNLSTFLKLLVNMGIGKFQKH